MGAYAKHPVCSLAEKCPKHQLPLELFCSEDWEGICEECANEHQEHPLIELEEAMAEVVFELKEQIKRVRGELAVGERQLREIVNQEEQLQREAEESMVQVRQVFQQVRDLIFQKEQESLDTVRNLREKRMYLVKIQKDQCQAGISNMKSLVELTNKAMELPAHALLKNINFLSNKLEKVQFNVFSNSIEREFYVPSVNEILRDLIPGERGSFFSERPSMIETPMSSNTPRALNTPRDSTASRNSTTPRNSNTPRSEQSSVPKFTSKQKSHNSIKLSWTATGINSSYVLEYGVGAKIQGVEQFREVYRGKALHCIITDLLPKTAYRFRVREMDEESGTLGNWSEVASVVTYEEQNIDEKTCLNKANVIKRAKEKWIHFEKAGIVLGKNPWSFGKSAWEVKIVCTSLFTTEEISGGLKVGISCPRSKQIIGTVYNYARLRGSVRILVSLDMEQKTLKCKRDDTETPEVFSLNENSVYPALQHKHPRNVKIHVKVLVKFDAEVDF